MKKLPTILNRKTNFEIIIPNNQKANGRYIISFDTIEQMVSIGFEEVDGRVGLIFNGVFYDTDSVLLRNNGTESKIIAHSKNKMNDTIYKYKKIYETDNFLISVEP